jgi:site-specific recombinase XerD
VPPALSVLDELAKATKWFEGLLRAYRLDLARAERAPGTIRLYSVYLRSFGLSLERDEITRESIERWTDQLRARYPNPDTRRLQLQILRGFLIWAAREDLVDARLWMHVRLPRKKLHEPRPLSLDAQRELEAFFERPRRDLVYLRDRALFWFLFQTGSRISAALSLERNALVDGQAIVRQKGGDELRLIAGRKAEEALDEYLGARRDQHPALFVHHDAAQGVGVLTAGSVNRRWKVYASALGIPAFTSHQLRHTTGTALRAQGVGIEDIADKLGHKTLDMARRYSAPARGRSRQLSELLEPQAPERPRGPLKPLTPRRRRRRS